MSRGRADSRGTRRAGDVKATMGLWRYHALFHALLLPVIARTLGGRALCPLLWLTYVVQQGDLRSEVRQHGVQGRLLPFTPVSAATECTLLRAYAAAVLLCGSTRPRRALVFGALTDIADGYLARRWDGASELGARLDGEYDAYLLLAAAHAARRRGGLTPWAEHLVWLRFAIVLLAGGVAYLLTPRRLTVRSTWPGKVASGLQALTLFSALSRRHRRARHWQSLAIAAGTILAVGGQILRLYRLVKTA